jgi:site-specific DNA recombinase
MMKSVVYARVSSKEQEQEGYSIPAQLKLLVEYASKSSMVIIKEFVDVETAKKAGRTQFNEMLKFLAENKDVKHILVEKTDRLLRNITDYATIDQLMTFNDLTLHLVKENIALSRDSRSNEKFIFGIKALMAKNYIDNLSEETKKGQREKAEQGTFPSLAPVGYLNYVDGKGRKSIRVDEEMAPHIQRMFDLYATGNYSLSTLRKEMLKDGFNYRSGKSFHRSHVEKILKNEFYTGVFYWDGKKYANATHPPLIDQFIFNRVQSVLRNPYKNKSRKDLFPYSNLIKCAKCGCALTGQIQKERFIYYHCTGYKGNCHTPYLRQEVIETQFGELLKSIKLSPQETENVYQGMKESLKDKMEYHNEAIKTLEQKIAILQKRIDAAYIDKIDGQIPEAFWRDQTDRWLKEKEDAAFRLLAHQKSDTHYLASARIVLELSNKAYDLFMKQDSAEKRKLVNILLLNSSFDGKVLEFTLRKPFDTVMECKKSANWGE